MATELYADFSGHVDIIFIDQTIEQKIDLRDTYWQKYKFLAKNLTLLKLSILSIVFFNFWLRLQSKSKTFDLFGEHFVFK